MKEQFFTLDDAINKICENDPERIAEIQCRSDCLLIGGTMRYLRKKAGFTQREIAGILGTSKPAISRLENDGTNVKLITLVRFAEATGNRLKINFESIEAIENQEQKEEK